MKRSGEVAASQTRTTRRLTDVAGSSIRDSQRSKVYRSERMVFHGSPEPPDSSKDSSKVTPDYKTVAECQEYVDHVTATDTWKALGFSHLGMFESHPVTVKDGRSRKRGAADAFGNTIKVPKWSRLKWYITHELAHIATSYIHDFTYDEDDEDGGGWPGYEDPETGRVVLTQTVATHGPEFAGIYLYLLRELVGVEAHDKLRAAFEEAGVKVAPAKLELVTGTATIAAVTDTDTRSEACRECGTVVFGSRREFCSDRCRWTYHNRERRHRTAAGREKTCEVCSKEFTAARSDAKTCSPRCRQRLHRRAPAR
jgi:hypothetical protein